MRFRRKTLGLIGAWALAAWAVCAQAAPAAEPAEVSRQRADFQRIHQEWGAFVNELFELRKAYAAAPADERAKLERKYDEMVEKGRVMEERLIDAAVLACVKQPDENRDLAYFLSDMSVRLLMNEEYEDAFAVTSKLIENRLANFMIFYFSGVAAFAINRFDAAERHFEWLDDEERRIPGRDTMKQRNLLKQIVAECRADLDYYQEIWPKEEALREKEKMENDLPRVRLETTKGDMVVELFENEAPNTVANFISLVEKGFYDGLPFFYVEQRMLAQTGCPEGNGSGGPGYSIRSECNRPDYRRHFRGSLTMATRENDPNSAGSQFGILFRPIRALDGNQTCFGRVREGIDVLARLQRRKPDPEIDPELLPEPDKIVGATVLRKRSHPYDPKIILPPPVDPIQEKINEEIMNSEGFAPF